MNYSTLLAIAEPQHNCITRNQALAVMTRRQLDGLVANGTLVRAFPSTYVLGGTRSTWIQTASAAVLSAPGAALSHQSAARLWGLTEIPSVRIVLTVPRGHSHIRRNISVHQSNQLGAFITKRRGIATTSVARTLIDLTSCVSRDRLIDVLNQARRMKLVTVAELAHCLRHMRTPGRSRISWMREELAIRDPLYDTLDTDWERTVLAWMLDAGLPVPKCQANVIVNGNRYIPDLCYPDLKIIVEADGTPPRTLSGGLRRQAGHRFSNRPMAGLSGHHRYGPG